MHLTNYSINKHNENFDRDDSDDSGSKRYNTTIFYAFQLLQYVCYKYPRNA